MAEVKVVAVKSFSAPGYGSYGPGDQFMLPEGVDWLEAGLVRKVPGRKPARKPRTKKAKG